MYPYVFIDDTVKVSSIDMWTSKGHRFGEGLMSPDRKFFYVNIPKNSSSYVKDILVANDWFFENYTDIDSQPEFLVVLRDPIKRWFSGMSEYLMMHHESTMSQMGIFNEPIGHFGMFGQQLGISLLFEKITFDDHTERQCMFLQDIPVSSMHFLDVDLNLDKNLDSFLTANGYHKRIYASKNETDKHGDDSAMSKYKIQEILKTVYQSNDSYHRKLIDWFGCDYELRKIAGFETQNNTE